MRMIKKRIRRITTGIAGVTLAVLIGSGAAFGTVGSNVMSRSSQVFAQEVERFDEVTIEGSLPAVNDETEATDKSTRSSESECGDAVSNEGDDTEQQSNDVTEESAETPVDSVKKEKGTNPETKATSSVEESETPSETVRQEAEETQPARRSGVGAILMMNNVAAKDEEGPVVKSVKFDKSEYKAGDTIKVTVTAEDASGVSDGYLEIEPDEDKYRYDQYINLEKQSDTVLTAEIKTDESWKNGTYSVSFLSVCDVSGNYTSFGIDDSSINLPTIKLTGCKDKEGPVVKKVSFDKASYKKGDYVIATIAAEDASGIYDSLYNDGHGTVHAAGYLGVEDSSGNRHTAHVRVDENGKIYAKFKIDDTWKNDKYTIKYIELYDKLENNREDGTTEWGSECDNKISSVNCGSFTVSDSKGDNEGPVVKAINFSKTNVKPGDTITVTADATDTSGVDHIDICVGIKVTGKDYEGNDYTRVEYRSYGNVSIRKNVSGSFAGELKVNNTWENGTYELYEVKAYDKLGNIKSYSYDPGSYGYETPENTDKINSKKITVSGSTEESPYRECKAIINSITFDKKSVKPGDVINVTADANNTKEIVLRIINENDFTEQNTNDYIWWDYDAGTTETYLKSKEVILTKDENGKLKGQIIIDDSFKNGEYSIQYLYAADEDGNWDNGYHLVLFKNGIIWGQFGQDKDKFKLFNATFSVSNAQKDTKGPVVKSVSIDKSEVKPGEEFILTLVLEDGSGLDPDSPIITIGTKDFLGSWTWNGNWLKDEETPLDGKWSFGLKVDNSVENGVYYLSELLLKDKLGNVTYLANELIQNNPNYYFSNRLADYHVSKAEVLDIEDLNVVKLTISGSDEEFNGPEIKSLKIDKTSAKQYEDKITLTATVENPTDIDHVLVGVARDTWASDNTHNVKLTKQSDGSIKGEIIPDEDWEPGEYYIYSLYAIDKNSKRYEVGYDRTNIDKKVEDIMIGSDRFEVIKNEMNISLDKKLLVLDKGKSGKLAATVTPAGAIDKTVTWSSSNTNVATVDASGNVTAVNHGTAKITAKTSNGKTAECEVRVNFADVASTGLYYYKPVYWAAENNITTGANGLFAPHNSCTREHAITFLWRMAGSPQPKSMVSKFKDVTNKNSYSYKAIMWGTEKGIITGTGGIFAPNNTCTREQIVTMLWRLAGKPVPKSTSSKFKDVQDKNRYSYNAILWASEKGITTGANGEFKPGKTCTRAEIVTFIYRYKNTVK